MGLGLLLSRGFRTVVSILSWFRNRRVPNLELSSDSDSAPSSSSSPVGTAAASGADPDSVPWWERTTAEYPGALVFYLGSQLQSDSEDRIRFAYLRGRQAAAIKRGELDCFSGPRAQLRNRCYVVLWSVHTEEPFVTWNYALFLSAVQGSSGGFEINSISHAFPSLAEATAFCLGAGLRACAPLR